MCGSTRFCRFKFATSLDSLSLSRALRIDFPGSTACLPYGSVQYDADNTEAGESQESNKLWGMSDMYETMANPSLRQINLAFHSVPITVRDASNM